MVQVRVRLVDGLVSLILAVSCLTSRGQSALAIYTDRLVNGFQDWSWATHNLSATSPVYSGSNSISVTASAWQALSFWHQDLNAGAYANVSFWINGGASGGQRIQLYAEYGTNSGPAMALATLPANTWKLIQVPLSSLGVATVTNLNRLNFQLTASGTAGTFYIDDLRLSAKPAPLVHLNVDATKVIRQTDSRWLGANTAVWDSNFDTSTTISLLSEMGTAILRFPGGSLSDEYHWASNNTLSNTWHWATSFRNFIHVATNVGAQAFITVNYGTGTPAEAAAWVRDANVTNHLGFKYWEIGNECYGTWETDTNAFPHDPYTYAVRAAAFYAQMKAADPSVKIGVVGAPGDDNYSNGYTGHPAINPRTGQAHNGWVPVMLSTLKSQGVTPDFMVHHRYPQYTDPANPGSGDSDSFLLQCSTAWFSEVSQLRQEISDYFGSGGTNIELVCTENNNDSGAQGRQSTSLVNGLYYADSLAQLMKTELNAFVWWDLRNGTDTSGSFAPELYGWRGYGDLGIINGLNTKHPTFYAAKLMRHFIEPGGRVLDASSDYSLLSAYATRTASGGLSVLVLHKDPSTNFDAQLSISGFVPDPSFTVYSYGIAQDEAARTNAPASNQDISTNTVAGASPSFRYSFPPYSMTLFNFAPTSPRLNVSGGDSPGAPILLELQGEPGVSYIIQATSDLKSWSGISTNALVGNSVTFTNAAATGPRYWRALWQP
jgi:alpha-L-arabinofuranosidase